MKSTIVVICILLIAIFATGAGIIISGKYKSENITINSSKQNDYINNEDFNTINSLASKHFFKNIDGKTAEYFVFEKKNLDVINEICFRNFDNLTKEKSVISWLIIWNDGEKFKASLVYSFQLPDQPNKENNFSLVLIQ